MCGVQLRRVKRGVPHCVHEERHVRRRFQQETRPLARQPAQLRPVGVHRADVDGEREVAAAHGEAPWRITTKRQPRVADDAL